MIIRPIYAHGYIKYHCEQCKRTRVVYCGNGVEDKNGLPAPSPIRCACGGLLKKNGGIVRLMVLKKIEAADSYFYRRKGCKCGVPVMKGKVYVNKQQAKGGQVRKGDSQNLPRIRVW